ncbi:MAG: dihydropteroate synthase [Acidobacteria bacterium]|nr:dihydropteroate synthase [Acidobacteriota bacterium]
MPTEPSKVFRVPKSVQIFVVRRLETDQITPNFEVLLLRRIESRGHFWQPITGRVEPGETIEATARRELGEETGLTPDDGFLFDAGHMHSYPLRAEWLVNYPPGTTHNDEFAYGFLASPTATIKIDPKEHESAQWVTFDEALIHLVWHGNRAALHCVQAHLAPRRRLFEWQLPQHPLHLGQRTFIMGIVNITPDSFSDGGQYYEPSRAVEHALQLANDGADIIDLGAESTRPGAAPITADEELSRILPVIEALRPILQIPISVDTYKASVAEKALTSGASIINDITGLHYDHHLRNVIAKSRAGVILMHSRGTPGHLHHHPPVANILETVRTGLKASIELALQAGISAHSIVIDPGIGFGKSFEDNLRIHSHLSHFADLGFPLLVGTSQKSFLGKILTQGTPSERGWGSATSITLAIQQGVHLVRVHDVFHLRQCCLTADAILSRIPF